MAVLDEPLIPSACDNSWNGWRRRGVAESLSDRGVAMTLLSQECHSGWIAPPPAHSSTKATKAGGSLGSGMCLDPIHEQQRQESPRCSWIRSKCYVVLVTMSDKNRIMGRVAAAVRRCPATRLTIERDDNSSPTKKQ